MGSSANFLRLYLVTTDPVLPKKTFGCGGTFLSAFPYLSLILNLCL